MIFKLESVNANLATADQIVAQFIFSVKITARIMAFVTFKQEYVVVVQDIRAMIVLKYTFNA